MGGSLEPELRWGLPDIVVTIRKPGDDAQLGIIKESMLDGSWRVALGTSGASNMITVTESEMELVLPKKTDKVKIVSGEFRGCAGKLMGIDGADGIVKLDDTLDIKILDMSSLGKVAT